MNVRTLALAQMPQRLICVVTMELVPHRTFSSSVKMVRLKEVSIVPMVVKLCLVPTTSANKECTTDMLPKNDLIDRG